MGAGHVSDGSGGARNFTPLGRVEGLDHSGVRESIGRKVNRPLRLADKSGVDGVKAFLGREMNLLRERGAYLRVSTDRQEKAGNGLEAQRSAIDAFAAANERDAASIACR